jgi:hypothetical protein
MSFFIAHALHKSNNPSLRHGILSWQGRDAQVGVGQQAILDPSLREQVGYLTSETIFDLGELPARLGVIGGPLGCESGGKIYCYKSIYYIVYRKL